MIYNNNKWEIFNKKPPILIASSFSNSLDNIWIANYTSYYESSLFYFDGLIWNKIFNPFGNQINSIYFSDKQHGAIGGLNEFAIYNKGKWNFLPVPANGIINNIVYENEKQIWLSLSGSNIIWHFDGIKWEHSNVTNHFKNLVKSINSKLYAFSDSTLATYKNSKWLIHSVSNLLLGVNSLSIIDNNNIWACGQGGKIIHYNNGKWCLINSPTKENLNKIVMENDSTGWIVGNNGIILNYNNSNDYTIHPRIGFRKYYLFSKTKIVDDKYGVVISDFTGNNYPDIIACSAYENNHYYINENSSLIESSIPNGLSKAESKTSNDFINLNLGGVAGDIDNDGDNDLLITSLNNYNLLYENYDSGHFRLPVFQSSKIGHKNDRSNSVAMGDIDNDGDLDLFITNETSSNNLLLNNGNGNFNDVTNSTNLITKGGGTGCILSDIDNDDDLDIIVVNWSRPNMCFKNMLSETGKLSFVDISAISGIEGFEYTKSNGIVSFDFDNDGDLDLYITNRKTSNRLYENDGKGIFADVTNKNIGIDSMKSYGVIASDIDNDGDKDLYISNVGENVLYTNNGYGIFTENTKIFDLFLSGYSTGLASGDMDNDGDIDIFAANFAGASSLLFINKIDNNFFIKVKVIGTLSNINGIGSKIYIYKAGHLGDINYLISFGEIQAGSGYASSNELIYHSGISDNSKVDVLVHFPATKIERKIFNIPIGQSIIVYEEKGRQKLLSNYRRIAINFFTKKANIIEVIKFSIVLFAIIFFFILSNKELLLKRKTSYKIVFVIIIFYWLYIYEFKYNGIFISTILPIAIVFLFLLVLYLYFHRRTIALKAISEKLQTRQQISRELHDDVASTLSSISMYNESLKRIINSDDKHTNRIFAKINSLLVEAAEAVTNIVWSTTPKHDTIKSLISRIRILFSDTCKENNLFFQMNVNLKDEKFLLQGEFRHNIYMICKEILHNIIKHANSKKITVEIIEDNRELIFIIFDDGIGIEKSSEKEKQSQLFGNGIENMRQRAKLIGADFSISQNNVHGTVIKLKVKNSLNRSLLN